MKADNPEDEHQLGHLNLFDLPVVASECAFGNLTDLAACLLEVPSAFISLLDEGRQEIKAATGLRLPADAFPTPFYYQAMQGEEVFVVPDTLEDPRFRDKPHVSTAPFIRFYAGMPLRAQNGTAIGVLAVMDYVPRRPSAAQLAGLRMLAQQVLIHLEWQAQRTLQARMAAEREHMHEILQRQAAHLREAQRIARIGSWELQVDTGALHCSDEIYRIVGIDPSTPDQSFNAFLALVHRDDQARLLAARENTVQHGVPLDIEHRIRRPGGEIRYVHERAEAYTDEQGHRLLAGTMQDVTARHKAQQHLRLLEAGIAGLNEIVMIAETASPDEGDPRIVFVNEAFEKLSGYRREDVLGKSPRLLQGPRTQLAEVERLEEAINEGRPANAELLAYTADGRTLWLEVGMTPVTDLTGQLSHFVAIMRDVTERNRHAQALAHSNRALRMLSRCNEVLLHAEQEQELLERICWLAVDVGGYSLAWVGYVEHDPQCSVRPIASAGGPGHAAEVASITLRWNEQDPFGQGPCGRAIRSGQPKVTEDIAKDPSFEPWRALTQARRYAGGLYLPLRDKDDTFGVLILHTSEVRSIPAEEVRLLQRVADNLAFGIVNIRSRLQRQRLEAAVVKVAAGVSASSGKEFFDKLVCNMAEVLDAQAAFVARFSPGTPVMVHTLSGIVDGQVTENFSYPITDTPCEQLLNEPICVVPDQANLRYPRAPRVGALRAQSYIGVRLEDSAGQALGLLCVMFREPVVQADIITSTLQIFAARAAAELERQEADTRIRNQASLLDQATDAIMVCGVDGRISFWNKGAERLYGWTMVEALGRSKAELLYPEETAFDTSLGTVLQEGEWRGEAINRRKDGQSLTVEAHWTLVNDAYGMPASILAINTDITQRKAAEQEIARLAFFDPLTRLPNRRLLLDRLSHALATADRSHHSGALLFIDLDNFKRLNDTLGHDKGDQLLTQVARRLEQCVRKSNTVARHGGDEFVIMLEDLSPDPRQAAAQAEVVGEKVLAAFNTPFQLGQYEHHSTPSVGVALFNTAVNDAVEPPKRADPAIYHGKAAGRNAVRFFDPEMQSLISARMALEADFRDSLQRGDFFLDYQAQTDGQGHVSGAEALVRWRHAQHGTIVPAAFLPLAEETGLIVHLGRWVLESACEQLARWSAQTHTAHLHVSVNVSARQFRHPRFVSEVQAALERTGAPPQRLRLEVTENLLQEHFGDAIQTMAALKAIGVGFSLDGFGTGYSSVASLKRLPLDQLKIDRSFVRDLLTDANHAAVARGIVALGQSLGLEVVAEGVETEDQRAFLERHGCRSYQGYLFSRPMPAEEILPQ